MPWSLWASGPRPWASGPRLWASGPRLWASRTRLSATSVGVPRLWTGAYPVEGSIWSVLGVFAALQTNGFVYCRRLASYVGVTHVLSAYIRNETPTVVVSLPVQELRFRLDRLKSTPGQHETSARRRNPYRSPSSPPFVQDRRRTSAQTKRVRGWRGGRPGAGAGTSAQTKRVRWWHGGRRGGRRGRVARSWAPSTCGGEDYGCRRESQARVGNMSSSGES